VLRIEKLHIHGLPPLTFEVAPGECMAVEGPSGSGKTELLRAIADLDAAPGYVSLGSVDRMELSGPAWRRQVRYCAPDPTWWEAVPRRHVDADASAARFARFARQLDVPEHRLDNPIADLTPSELRRLALARALADEPKVLLLDDPANGLDPVHTALVEEVIRFQLLAGRIAMLVSRDASLIDRLADARLELAPPAQQPEVGG